VRRKPIAALAAKLSPPAATKVVLIRIRFSIGAQAILAVIRTWLPAIFRLITDTLVSPEKGDFYSI
jgi:hypothetical protein